MQRFPNRGPIEKVDNISPPSVQLSLSPNKYKIIWSIGQQALVQEYI